MSGPSVTITGFAGAFTKLGSKDIPDSRSNPAIFFLLQAILEEVANKFIIKAVSRIIKFSLLLYVLLHGALALIRSEDPILVLLQTAPALPLWERGIRTDAVLVAKGLILPLLSRHCKVRDWEINGTVLFDIADLDELVFLDEDDQV